MNDISQLPLRDIHLPNPISWWPLAAGWWIVICSSVVLLILSFLVLRKYFKLTLRKEALKSLESIQNTYAKDHDAVACLAELSSFLRRVMLSRAHGTVSASITSPASLTGQAWLEFLDKSLDKPEFSTGAGQLLLDGPYQSTVDNNDLHDLLQLCQKWVNYI